MHNQNHPNNDPPPLLVMPREIFHVIVAYLKEEEIKILSETCKEILSIFHKNHSNSFYNKIGKSLIPHIEQGLKDFEQKSETFKRKNTVGFFNPGRGDIFYRIGHSLLIIFCLPIVALVIWRVYMSSLIDSQLNEIASQKKTLMEQLLPANTANLDTTSPDILSILNTAAEQHSNLHMESIKLMILKSGYEISNSTVILVCIFIFASVAMSYKDAWEANNDNAAAAIDNNHLETFENIFNKKIWQEIIAENPNLGSRNNKQLSLQQVYVGLDNIQESIIDALNQFKKYHQSLLLEGLQGKTVKVIDLTAVTTVCSGIIQKFIEDYNSLNEEQFNYCNNRFGR